MTVPVLSGRCLCGRVRYRCGAPLYPATFCHCESCRRAQGAHAIAWLTVPAASVAYGAERPHEYQSSPGVHRGFCAHCGTPLTYRNDTRAAEIDLTLATLDRAGEFAPSDHIWMEDALAWDRPGDGLPQHPRARRA
jgi:hypothetical protein